MMKATKFHVAWLAIILTLLRDPVKGELFAECEGVESQTFTGSPTSCRRYIFCNGEDSYSGDCGQEQYFDKRTGLCDDQEQVDCEIEKSPAKSTRGTTENTSPATVVSTFTTRAPQITTPFGRTSTAEPTSLNCPHVYDVVFLPHPKECNSYYACVNGTPIKMLCPSILHFNAKTSKCDYPEKVKCSLSYMQPQQEPLQPHRQCRRETASIYPHPKNCNYYYYCRKGFLLIQQCPFFYGWDIEQRACIQLKRAKCYGL